MAAKYGPTQQCPACKKKFRRLKSHLNMSPQCDRRPQVLVAEIVRAKQALEAWVEVAIRKLSDIHGPMQWVESDAPNNTKLLSYATLYVQSQLITALKDSRAVKMEGT